MTKFKIDEIVEQYGSKVYNLAFLYTFNRQDGDIAQKTFLLPAMSFFYHSGAIHYLTGRLNLFKYFNKSW